jgi:hypothetical protein
MITAGHSRGRISTVGACRTFSEVTTAGSLIDCGIEGLAEILLSMYVLHELFVLLSRRPPDQLKIVIDV